MENRKEKKKLEGSKITCRPEKAPPDNYEKDIFKTHCYKCGRIMVFVRGKRKEDKKWKDDWILDQEYWGALAFKKIFDFKMDIKIDQKMPEFCKHCSTELDESNVCEVRNLCTDCRKTIIEALEKERRMKEHANIHSSSHA